MRLIAWIVRDLGYTRVVKESGLRKATLDKYLAGEVPLYRQRQNLINFHYWVEKTAGDRYPPPEYPPHGLLDLAGSPRQRLPRPPANDDAEPGDVAAPEQNSASQRIGAHQQDEHKLPQQLSSMELREDLHLEEPSATEQLRSATVGGQQKAPSPGDPEPKPTDGGRGGDGRARVIAAGVVAFGVLLGALALLLPQTAGPADPTLTFTDLGGGSSVINVYSSATDRQSQAGTFEAGQTAPVACRTTGRQVSSHPELGEAKASSTDWVRLRVNRPMYATLTYGTLDRALETIPKC